MPDQLDTKRTFVQSVMTATLGLIEPAFIDQEQKEVFIDAMWGILGSFDAQSSYEKNMTKLTADLNRKQEILLFRN